VSASHTDDDHTWGGDQTVKTHTDALDELCDELKTLRRGRLEVGWRAHAALSELRRPDVAPWYELPLAALFGVPIVPSQTLLPSQWRLYDGDGQVVDAGIVP
jgi:hypothetical protein